MKTHLRALLLTWVAAAAAAAPITGQNLLLDQGTFRVTVRGLEPGTETFTIEQTGSGPDTRVVSRGRLELGGRLTSSVLVASPQLAFLKYEGTSIQGSDSAHVDIGVMGRRLIARIRSKAGDQERELRSREGAVVLEDNVAHLYYFTSVLEPGTVAPVVDARGNDQSRLTLLAQSSETITIGGQDLAARRLRFALDGVERTVWLDNDGRVLRVEVPSTGYLAERVRPPR